MFTDTKENAQSCSDGILSLLINKQTEIYSSMLEEIVKKKNYFKKIIEYPEFGKSLDIPNFLVTEDMLINAQSTYYQLDYLIKNHRYNPPKLLGDFIIRSSPNLKSHFYILGGIFGLFIGVLIGWMRHFYKKNN